MARLRGSRTRLPLLLAIILVLLASCLIAAAATATAHDVTADAQSSTGPSSSQQELVDRDSPGSSSRQTDTQASHQQPEQQQQRLSAPTEDLPPLQSRWPPVEAQRWHRPGWVRGWGHGHGRDWSGRFRKTMTDGELQPTQDLSGPEMRRTPDLHKSKQPEPQPRDKATSLTAAARPASSADSKAGTDRTSSVSREVLRRVYGTRRPGPWSRPLRPY